jgi:type II secretory pathway pseudopilin PulG
MVVVIGIIILIIAVAVPAIRSLTGTRSIDAGYNTLSALVTQAREEAVGLQEVRGVLFYLNPVNDRVEAVIVQQTPPPATVPTPAPVYYLDVVPNRDYVVLPPGIGVQTVNSPTTTYTDKYLGFNPTATFGSPSATNVLYGGVILFDGNGRLVSATYGFKLFTTDVSGNMVATNLATMLAVNASPQPQFDLVPMAGTAPLSSQFGFVLFDREAFKAQGYTDGDDVLDNNPQINAANEATEETWLDTNAAPILINRYNGTLIRGE